MVKVLQGTDGIRGKVHYGRVDDPLSAFIDERLITADFTELYTFGVSSALTTCGLIREGDGVVVGFDGRDESGYLTVSTIRGIIRAGLRPVLISDFTEARPTLGRCLPTPAVPLYMAYTRCNLGFMITASHNPYYENGIKIFISPLASKPLLRDDVLLSEAIYSSDMSAINNDIEMVFEEDYENAFKVFTQFHSDEKNSWISEGISGLRIIIDPSNGALTHIASSVLSEIDGIRVREVVGYEPYRINEDCGVVELEGVKFISLDEIVGEEARFSRNRPLIATAREAMKHYKVFRAGKEVLLQMVFDGDGDRLFVLVFDPFEEGFHILSGDEIAIMLVDYMLRSSRSDGAGLFVSTIEGDIGAVIRARELGLNTRVVGVGDKWLLREAVALMLKHLKANIDPLYYEGGSVIEATKGLGWDDLTFGDEAPFFGLSVGSEASGHIVTQGYMDVGSGIIPSFSGNALKSSINILTCISNLFIENSLSDFLTLIKEPFKRGYKKNLTCYFSDRALFFRGSQVFEHLLKVAYNVIERFGSKEGDVSIDEKVMPEAPDMLYLSFSVGGRESFLYIRNSGTEEKTAIYIRGDIEIEDTLCRIIKHIFGEMVRFMKDRENPSTMAEVFLLKAIKGGIKEDDILSDVEMKYPGVDAERVLNIALEKEEAVVRKGSDYRLTGIGEEIVKSYGDIL